MRRPLRREVVVRGLGAGARTGLVTFGPLVLACALGRNGRRVRKREGDGATPVGRWTVREMFYRPDRIRRPQTRLKVRPVRPRDGWCDAPGDRNYNRAVALPYPARTESLWRADRLYDVVVVLGYNDRPRVQGRGSAVFLHLAAEGLAPTAGCVALRPRDALRLIERLAPGDRIRVTA
jgi:L,D-peptidoglycan transpeptidase YkuD (ErfK/YbiS/YcfS/YnhG family)